MYIKEFEDDPSIFHVLIVCTLSQYEQFKSGKYLYNPEIDEFKQIKDILPSEQGSYITYKTLFDPLYHMPEEGYDPSYESPEDYDGDICESEYIDEDYVSTSGDKIKVFGFCYRIY